MSEDKKVDSDSIKLEIKEEDGLRVEYETQDLKEKFPNLLSEITNQQKAIKIDSIEFDSIDANSEKNNEIETKKKVEVIIDDLSNPGAIDFIRRCNSKKEAIEILDYLLERKELIIEEYEAYIYKLNQEDGLERLISEYGGPKKPGYYLRQYYKKPNTNQKPKTEKN